MPAVFGNYFTDREIADLNIAEIIKGAADKIAAGMATTGHQGKTANLPARIAGLRSDINILDNIIDGNIKIKSFDYDGKSFSQKKQRR